MHPTEIYHRWWILFFTQFISPRVAQPLFEVNILYPVDLGWALDGNGILNSTFMTFYCALSLPFSMRKAQASLDKQPHEVPFSELQLSHWSFSFYSLQRNAGSRICLDPILIHFNYASAWSFKAMPERPYHAIHLAKDTSTQAKPVGLSLKNGPKKRREKTPARNSQVRLSSQGVNWF